VSDEHRQIRDLVDNWAIWRDAGDWERFATVWHDDGLMMATWFQGSAIEFIRASRESFERGVSILHFLGGTSIDHLGERAIAQTKMTISQRAAVHGVECDVVCTGRFYDFLERRDGRWGIVLRHRSTRRTGSIRSIQRRDCSSTPSCWTNSRSATGTSPTCRPGSVTK
jgi:SnoaL-like domain